MLSKKTDALLCVKRYSVYAVFQADENPSAQIFPEQLSNLNT